jgi:3-deoxy-7-phosphoheptulonate synthase
LIGDTTGIDIRQWQALPEVDQVIRVADPYKRANRKFHPENSIITIGKETIGGQKLGIIAGPCSVESEEQIVTIAKQLKQAGANFLRGGAFKPRTSPYSFQGLELEGLKMLQVAKAETGLPIVTELMSTKWVDQFVDSVDIIQIGARNMQNFDLLKEVGRTKTPILLKRGLSATYKEWLMSAEYIMAAGNDNVILCERGIRTFETETRNTLDIQAVPVIKELSHLPIIVDPSHAGGMSYLLLAQMA